MTPGLLVCAGLLGLVGTLVGGCSIPGSEVVDGEGIVGTYTLNGVDHNDVEYSGTVVIAARDDSDLYAIQWIVTGAIHEGTAELSGDRLEATWRGVINPSGETSGTATYVLDDQGNLTGSKTMDGVEGVATETIFQEA